MSVIYKHLNPIDASRIHFCKTEYDRLFEQKQRLEMIMPERELDGRYPNEAYEEIKRKMIELDEMRTYLITKK